MGIFLQKPLMSLPSMFFRKYPIIHYQESLVVEQGVKTIGTPLIWLLLSLEMVVKHYHQIVIRMLF
jgi:hypothetical protein